VARGGTGDVSKVAGDAQVAACPGRGQVCSRSSKSVNIKKKCLNYDRSLFTRSDDAIRAANVRGIF